MPSIRVRGVLGLCLAVAGAGSARADDTAPARQQARAERAVRVRAVFARHCSECHTGRTDPGHSLLPLPSHKAAIDPSAPIPFVKRGDPAASLIVQLIRDGSMPPGGRPRLNEKEVELIEDWIKEGAPSFPRSFDDAGTLEALLDDWEKLPAGDRPFVRYVTFAHLVQGDARPANLDAHLASLREKIPAATGKSVSLERVDDTATLCRLDLRTTRWGAENLFERVIPGKDDEPSSVTPFDLILLEYPLAPPDAGNVVERLRPFLTATNQVRPLPFLRADWLSAALAAGKPLAADLESLAQLKVAMERNEQKPSGPTGQPFPPFAQITDPKVGLAPLEAWYAWDAKPNAGPFALKVKMLTIGGKVPTKRDEVFNLFATATTDLHLELLIVSESGTMRLTIEDEDGPAGRMKAATEKERRLGPTGERHYSVGNLVQNAQAKSFALVLFASDKPFPAPTVIRSKHPASQIWRIVPDEANGFDPKRVVRHVLPIRIEQ